MKLKPSRVSTLTAVAAVLGILLVGAVLQLTSIPSAVHASAAKDSCRAPLGSVLASSTDCDSCIGAEKGFCSQRVDQVYAQCIHDGGSMEDCQDRAYSSWCWCVNTMCPSCARCIMKAPSPEPVSK